MGNVDPNYARHMLEILWRRSMDSPCSKMHFAAMAFSEEGMGMGGVCGWYRDGVFSKPVPCVDGCLRAGVESGTSQERCRSFHAEQVSIMRAHKRGIDLSGGTMYVAGRKTSAILRDYPGFYCTLCARTMRAAGIANVVVAVKDEGHEDGWSPAVMTMDEVWNSAYGVAPGKEDFSGNTISDQ